MASAPADASDQTTMGTPSVSRASPAPSSSSIVSALARLTPEQLQKLRRMQKLRALLQKLPPGVTLKKAPAAAAAAATDEEQKAAPDSSADALLALAGVACM